MLKKVKINRLLTFIIIFSLFIISCSKYYKYIETEVVNNNLYLELYYNGDFVEYFLTDSLYFTEYVGFTDPENGQTLKVKLNGDKISIFNKSKPSFCKIFVATQISELSLNKLKYEKKNNRNY